MVNLDRLIDDLELKPKYLGKVWRDFRSWPRVKVIYTIEICYKLFTASCDTENRRLIKDVSMGDYGVEKLEIAKYVLAMNLLDKGVYRDLKTALLDVKVRGSRWAYTKLEREHG